jgi:glucokinase
VTILGFDIGGTNTSVNLGTLDAEILLSQKIPTPVELPFEAALGEILACADEVLEKAHQQGIPAPAAVSVAVGGPLDIEQGIIYSPPHLPNWSAAPLKQQLTNHFKLPVLIEHDGNAGALAEFYFGAGRDVQNLVFLTLGTGLGAGIILNGQLVRGASDTAGEVGHIRLALDGPQEYGKAGSWESFCSAAGLEKLAHMRQPGFFPPNVRAEQIIHLALEGNPESRQVVAETGYWLGRGLAILVDVLNPELIVLGTLGRLLGDLLLDPARRLLAEEALAVARQACRLEPAQLGERLGAVSSLIAVIAAVRQGRLVLPTTLEEQLVRQALQAGPQVRQRTLEKLLPVIHQSALLLVETLKNGHKILVCGNGGSAASAQHLAGELVGRYKGERRALPAIALTADSNVVTCIGNDYGYEEVFARQVTALAAPGDLVIGLTTSGRSKNVLKALQVAQELGARTLALTGEKGLPEPVADTVLAVPSAVTAYIQEEHDAIIHAWCEVIDYSWISAGSAGAARMPGIAPGH